MTTHATTIGPYHADAVLEHGSLGPRYRATTAHGSPVIIETTPLQSDPELFERALRRITVMADATHRHLVPILDAGLDGDHLFAVTPAPSHTAEDLGPCHLAAGPIIADVASGLSHLHQSGVLHRDIQLRHIGVFDGIVKLGGFGLTDVVGPGRTNGIGPIGSVLTMAPSIVTGQPATTGSDVYSLGAALHLLATGRAVHPRRAESMAQRIVRIGTEPPTLDPTLPLALLSAVISALNVDGTDAPTTAVLASLIHDIDGSRTSGHTEQATNHAPETPPT